MLLEKVNRASDSLRLPSLVVVVRQPGAAS